MAQYILSIDQGTTGTTVILMNASTKILGKVNHEYPQIFPKPGWVEHNLNDIWNSVTLGIGEVLRRTGIDPKSIAAIGITNQRETVGAWHRQTGTPFANAIVWQCRRTTERCQALRRNKTLARRIQAKTGLVLDPYFSGTKIEWLFKNVDGLSAEAKKGRVAVGTIESFLVWKLTGGRSHVTDVSNASRTMLMNLKTLQWDPELLRTFHVPENVLPQIVDSSGEVGRTYDVPGLPDGIPIAGLAGDQQSALFGQAAFTTGEAKCTFGTGSFILMNTGEKVVTSKKGLLTTVAWRLKGEKKPTYALEGGAFICGAAVQWLRDGLQFFSSSAEVEALARSVSDTGGVEFVPALTGLGAPHWNPEARGLMCGLTRGSTRAHVARATLEAMALQNADILSAMQKDLGRKLVRLKVDGGAAANDLLMSLQADYLGVTIQRPEIIETTAAGAAYLAGLGVGFWSSKDEIKTAWRLESEFFPTMKSSARAERLKRWATAVARTF
jgi:glycerol kinase